MGNKGQYSKNKLLAKRWIIIVIIALILLLIGSIAFVIYINTTNNIVYENINVDSSSVDDNIASQSTPIVINNIILGAVYNGKWVSMERYFFKSANKKGYDIDIFTNKGKTGSFKLNDVSKTAEATVAYTTTTRTNYKDEYYAAKAGTASTSKMDEITLNEENIKEYKVMVKKALGLYGILNDTVKIREAYAVALIPGELSYIITATNDGKTNNGVYSTVIYVNTFGEAKIVKYNYIKNVNNSSNFGIYTAKFIADLNSDNTSEIILQETKEFNTKYSVMQFSSDKFYEVLSTSINN